MWLCDWSQAVRQLQADFKEKLRLEEFELSKDTIYIFLDIDGVLSPEPRNDYVFDKDCLAHFENAIRTLDDVKIVISSTWKLVYSLKEIKGRFSPDIQPLIVGMTPDAYGKIEPYERHGEVLAYLRLAEDEDAEWVAIDDDSEHYPKKCTVILTGSSIGFNHTSALKLRKILEHQSL